MPKIQIPDTGVPLSHTVQKRKDAFSAQGKLKGVKKWYERGGGVVEESMGWPPPKGSESYSYPQGYFGLRHDVAEVPVRVMPSGSSLGKALDKQEEDLPFKKLQRR